MKLSICRSIVVTGIVTNNSTVEHPAVVNRVWGDGEGGPAGCIGMVNATVFPDMGTPTCLGSINVFADKAAADSWIAQRTEELSRLNAVSARPVCGYLPARV